MQSEVNNVARLAWRTARANCLQFVNSSRAKGAACLSSHVIFFCMKDVFWLLCALLPSWVACMVQSDLTFEHVLARLYCCASSIFLPFQHSLVTASGAQFPALLSFKPSLGNPCALNCAQLFAHLGPSRLRRLSRHFDDFRNAASLKSILGRRTSITPTFKVGAL